MPRPVAVALRLGLLAPLLAGCAAGSDLVGTPTGAAPSLAAAVPVDRALAALPREAGAVVSVVERRDPDRLRQTITLAADPTAHGDDRIEVDSRRRTAGPAPRIDAATIDAELAEALPGVAMTVSSRVPVTAAGPIGVATGRTADGLACLYAWSETETRTTGTTRPIGFGLALVDDDRRDLSVRVRLCRRGVAEERLIAWAEGLRLSVDAGSAGRAEGVAAAGRDALESAGWAAAPVEPGTPTPRRATTRKTTAAASTGSLPPRIDPTPIPLPTGD